MFTPSKFASLKSAPVKSTSDKFKLGIPVKFIGTLLTGSGLSSSSPTSISSFSAPSSSQSLSHGCCVREGLINSFIFLRSSTNSCISACDFCICLKGTVSFLNAIIKALRIISHS